MTNDDEAETIVELEPAYLIFDINRGQCLRPRGESKEMILWIAIGLAVIAGVSHPFGARLQGTGLWAGKALAPPEAASAYPRGIQSALTDGWPSTISLVISLAPFAPLLLGFFHAWWAGIIAFFVALFVSEIAKRASIAPRAVDYYLAIFVGHADRRRADYAASGDTQRAEAAKELADQLQELLSLYMNSGVPAPTVKEARNAPYGDTDFLLEVHSLCNPGWKYRGEE